MQINPEIKAINDLSLISYKGNDIDIITNLKHTDYYFAGNLEYNQFTLAKEYECDLKINSNIPTPENYFIDDSSIPLEERWYNSAEEIYKFILKKNKGQIHVICLLSYR